MLLRRLRDALSSATVTVDCLAVEPAPFEIARSVAEMNRDFERGLARHRDGR